MFNKDWSMSLNLTNYSIVNSEHNWENPMYSMKELKKNALLITMNKKKGGLIFIWFLLMLHDKFGDATQV